MVAKTSTYRARLKKNNYFVISPLYNSCFVKKPFRVLNYPGPFTIFVSSAKKYPFKSFPQTVYAHHYYFGVKGMSECRFDRGGNEIEEYKVVTYKLENYMFHLNRETRLQKILDGLLKHKDEFLFYIPNAARKNT